MDLKTCILGCTPPILAMVAEKWSPVSRSVVFQQSFDLAPQHIAPGLSQQDFDAQRSALAETMTGIAIGAAEASGLVPTWIGVISALTAVFIDIVDPIVCLSVVAVATAVTAILGVSFFAGLNLYLFGNRAAERFGCPTGTRSECASRWVIVLNGVVAAVVVAVWLYPFVPWASLSSIGRALIGGA